MEKKSGKNQKAMEKLFLAAEQGDIKLAERALYLGADVNGRNEFGHTPLTFAAASGKLSVKMLLLLHQNGADLNSQDNSGCNALMLAAGCGCLDIHMLKLFHGFGTDIKARDALGQTVMQYAAMEKKTCTPEIFRMLHKYGVSVCYEGKPEWDALNMCSVAGTLTVPVLKCLVELGGDINARDERTGNTPLIELVKNGNIIDNTEDNELFLAMIELGADVNARDKYGKTAFLYIMERKILTAYGIRMFKDAGADITVRSDSGDNVLASILFNNNAWDFFNRRISAINTLFDLGFSIQDMYPDWTIENFSKRILNSSMEKTAKESMALFFAMKLGPEKSAELLKIIEQNRVGAVEMIASLPRDTKGIKGLEEILLKTLVQTKGRKIFLDSNNK